VPHNLISTQESPVPLLKFQMAPRLKILMASSSTKGTQIHFFFLSKVLANEPPPGSPSTKHGQHLNTGGKEIMPKKIVATTECVLNRKVEPIIMK
jgi:hypothetical protein